MLLLWLLLLVQDPQPTKRICLGDHVDQGVVKKELPAYPAQAKKARIQGAVRFEATLATNGSVLSLKLVSGHPMLVLAAREAIRKWQYKPTLLNGNPVEVITQAEVSFKLDHPKDNPKQEP